MAKKISFEDNIKELEKIVERLESGDSTLDESLELFANGVNTIKLCQKVLDEAEQKVTVLCKGEDKVVEKEFTELNA